MFTSIINICIIWLCDIIIILTYTQKKLSVQVQKRNIEKQHRFLPYTTVCDDHHNSHGQFLKAILKVRHDTSLVIIFEYENKLGHTIRTGVNNL